MANLYTKTGDKGQTSLIGGTRVDKNNIRVECYGTIDEVNSMLGLAYSQTTQPYIRESIHRIQQMLFVVAAELASDFKGIKLLKRKIEPEDVKYLENIVDECTKIVGKQTNFVIPGVNPPSAALHVARTIVRRAERSLVTLNHQKVVREVLLEYVNRLSDTVYALARLEETYAQNSDLKEEVTKLVQEKLNNLKTQNFDLDTIKKMAEFSEKKAKEINVPVVFSAVDAGGNLILMHRMEGSLLASLDISCNKAYTANAFKMPTHELAKVSLPGESLYGAQNTNNGRVTIIGGGFPCYKDGKIVGAIGVSGGTVEQDMQVAQYALDQVMNK